MDNPTSPYSPTEQQRVMRDLHQSLRTANVEKDEARIFYTTQIINEDEKDYE